MKGDLSIKNGIVIPENELEITASRAGGPGGQHVNKSDTKITVRWNVNDSKALSEELKERILKNLPNRLTAEGDLIIHNSSTRSQQQNKKLALDNLVKEIRKALYVQKKRKPTEIPKGVKESRLLTKLRRGKTKKLRSKRVQED